MVGVEIYSVLSSQSYKWASNVKFLVFEEDGSSLHMLTVQLMNKINTFTRNGNLQFTVNTLKEIDYLVIPAMKRCERRTLSSYLRRTPLVQETLPERRFETRFLFAHSFAMESALHRLW